MYFTYLWRELRRRRRQASLVAIGLAVGVGLVVTVAAASTGVNAAQGAVLHSLYGVGTDLTVTKAPSFGSGGPFQFGGAARGAKPATISGQHLSSSPGLAVFPATDASRIADLKDVRSAAPGLVLNDFTFSGKFQPGSGFAPGAPPSGTSARASFSANSFTVAGVDIASPGLGPLSGASVTAGAYLSSSDRSAKVALVDSAYAQQKGLKVGSTLTIATTSYRVIGIVSPASGSAASDVYLPLADAQAAAGDEGEVNTVYVQADNNSTIRFVQAAIKEKLPSLTVTTAAALASQVSDSLGTASSLASSLGRWLAGAVLVVAFALAAMLTMASVSGRVREFGTLKALGWKSRRVVGQILGEGLVSGVLGAALGVGLGFLGAFLVARIGGTVKVPVGATTVAHFRPSTGAPGGGPFGAGRAPFLHDLGAAANSVTVHLTAPVSLEIVGLAVMLGLAGGLLAGALGGWRVARLRPAEALRRVE